MSGSTYGKVFTVSTFGESHGKAVGVVVDGGDPTAYNGWTSRCRGPYFWTPCGVPARFPGLHPGRRGPGRV